ncbi:cathepsin O-like [Saccoglossus kowalevskii]
MVDIVCRSIRLTCTYCVVLVLCYLPCAIQYDVQPGNIDEDVQFKEFILKHRKPYIAGTTEYEHRFRVFQQSLHRIRKRISLSRQLNDTAVYGITQFSDLTPDEFQQMYLTLRPSKSSQIPVSLVQFPSAFNSSNVPPDMPKKYDLRDKSAVSAVKDQGSCGGCWSFSTVQGMETKWVLNGGKMTELSVQQLIDCDTSSSGCAGGDTCIAMAWLKTKNVGLITSHNYPFTGHTGECRIKNYTEGVHLKDFTCKEYIGKEDKMVENLYYNGSLVVALNARSWQDYLGGIIQHHCSAGFNNHAVQIVGYDPVGPVPYYVVRNTWGLKFGLQGYLNIKIGDNVCGIASRVSTVETVKT